MRWVKQADEAREWIGTGCGIAHTASTTQVRYVDAEGPRGNTRAFLRFVVGDRERLRTRGGDGAGGGTDSV